RWVCHPQKSVPSYASRIAYFLFIGDRWEFPPFLPSRRGKSNRSRCKSSALPRHFLRHPPGPSRHRGDPAMNPEPFLRSAASHLPDTLDLLRRLVALNSFTTHAAGVDAVGRLTAEAFAPLGFDAEWIPSR